MSEAPEPSTWRTSRRSMRCSPSIPSPLDGRLDEPTAEERNMKEQNKNGGQPQAPRRALLGTGTLAAAAVLVSAINGLRGTPVAASDVAAQFSAPAALIANPTIMNVLKFATGAERNAAVSYNKVLAGLEDAQLRYLATSIEGDESQHFI